jgi:hypothetical protein
MEHRSSPTATKTKAATRSRLEDQSKFAALLQPPILSL